MKGVVAGTVSGVSKTVATLAVCRALQREGRTVHPVKAGPEFIDVVRGSGLDGEHDGLTEYRTLGTYAHVHAASGAFDRFVAAAEGE